MRSESVREVIPNKPWQWKLTIRVPDHLRSSTTRPALLTTPPGEMVPRDFPRLGTHITRH